MSLGGDLAAALPGLRSEANSMMLSQCTISRATGEKTTNDAYEEVDVYALVYTGICRFKAANTEAGRAEIPGAIIGDQSATVSLPIGVFGADSVLLNDIWECTSNPLDPSKVGRKARVTGGHSQTFATAHRYPVEEVL